MKKSLKVEIPDTLEFAIQVGYDRPFALWDIVEQPLLYHWFDFAIDHGFAAVEIQTPENARESVKTAVEAATLWPLEIKILDKSENSAPAFSISYLPEFGSPISKFCGSGSELMTLKRKLVRTRLDYIWSHIIPNHSYYAIGRNNYLHPDTILNGPYWIGNDCVIDEGSYIGPYSCIGANSVLNKNVSLEDSTVASGLAVQSGLTFSSHDVSHQMIFNHRKNIRHTCLGNDIITTVKP